MADPPTDYVGYWPMNGNLSPGGGTPTGSPGYVSGQVDQALQLTGTGGQYITLSSSPLTSGQISAGWSVTAWFQDSDPGTTHGTSSKHAVISCYVDANNHCCLGDHANGVSASVYIASAQTWADQSPAVAITANTWTHIACVWNGSAFTLYRNGSSIGSSSVVHTAPGGSFIGQLSAGNGYLTGLVDEVRVYAYALTAQQVADCYNYTGASATPVPLRKRSRSYLVR